MREELNPTNLSNQTERDVMTPAPTLKPNEPGAVPLSPKPTDPLRKRIPKKKREYPTSMKLHFHLNTVVKHFARIYVNKAGADPAVALEWMKPGYEEHEYEAYAREVMRMERVQAAIDEEYREIGIDEDGRKRYIGELWKKLQEGNEKTQQVVLGLLGRALGIGEMQDESRIPSELPIKNLDKGWEAMTNAAAREAQNPTGFGGAADDTPGMDD